MYKGVYYSSSDWPSIPGDRVTNKWILLWSSHIHHVLAFPKLYKILAPRVFNQLNLNLAKVILIYEINCVQKTVSFYTVLILLLLLVHRRMHFGSYLRTIL